MRIDVITIFPRYLAPLREALLGKAIDRGLIELYVHDLRDHTHDVHRAVDDAPYGGGPGMVMKPQVWGEALDAVCGPGDRQTPGPGDRQTPGPGDRQTPGPGDRQTPGPGDRQTPGPDDQPMLGPGDRPMLVVPTPAGRPFTQTIASQYASRPWLVFACGRYEGIDQRVIEDAARRMPVDEVSIGDYVLVGGEAAVLVIVEAVARLLPGVLGNPVSAREDSHVDGLLEGPSYTRPEQWRGLAVPPVLRSGDHGSIARWRRDQAIERTFSNRPDLIAALPEGKMDEHDRALLDRLRTRPDRG
jgi:tRNA (guanine37-N1)-methyltransferase